MQVINNIHNRIQYENSHWVVYDGDGNKPSTNSTWIYIEDSYEIQDGMVFKAGQTLIRIKIE